MVFGASTLYLVWMRIDPKYFNHFMVIVAVICILAIIFASLRYSQRQEQRFLDRLDNKSLSELVFMDQQGDTLYVNPDQTTVLLFWATWSDRSLEELYDLYNWHDRHPHIEVISAFVKDAEEFAKAHDRENKNSYRLVNGTPAYQDLRVPGVPTAVVFDSGGKVKKVQSGSQTVPIWHEVSTRQELQHQREQEEG